MKRELNSIVKKTSAKVNEVFLFRTMSDILNRSGISYSTYVENIHGTRGLVEFPSRFRAGGSAIKELGDMLIFTFDKCTRDLRMCVLQAKYRKRRYYNFLNIRADLFQWELLFYKPNIIDKSAFHFPSNILNFRTDYKSISAYGIFYRDNICGDIDFLYTIPKHFTIPSISSIPPTGLLHGDTSFQFRCPNTLGSPNYICMAGISKKETISTCSIDVFEDQVQLCKIGVPIPHNDPIGDWAMALLKKMREYADNPVVINEILRSYEAEMLSYNYSFNGTPSALIVVTDSNKYKEFCLGRESSKYKN